MAGAASSADSDVLYDTHAHFFTNDLRRYPIDIANGRENEDQLRQRILSAPSTAQTVLRLWDENRVIGGCAVQYSAVYKTDNRFTLDVAEQHPGRLSPVVVLNSLAADAAATFAWHATERGAVGLRLSGRAEADGSYPWLDSPVALQSWDVASRYGLTMVLMYLPGELSPSALETIGRLARQFPAATVALDHCGWAGGDAADSGFAPSLSRLSQYRNVFYKFSTLNFLRLERSGLDAAQFIRRAANLFGSDHIMWGSDFGNSLEPYSSMANRARVAAALLSPAEQRQFMCDTGRTLFARR